MLRLPLRTALTVLGLLPLLALRAETTPDAGTPWKTLFADVKSVPLKGTYTGQFTPVGKNAFALVVDKDSRISVVAGYFHDDTAKGRVVAFGHDAIPERSRPFLKNLVAWAATKPDAKVAVFGDDVLVKALVKAGFAATRAKDAASVADSDLVFLKGSGSLADPAIRDAILAHLEKGKGVAVAVTTWAQKPEEAARLETLLLACGLHTAGEYEITGDFKPGKEPSPLLSVVRASEALAGGKLAPKDVAVAARTLEGALDLAARPAELDKVLAGLRERYGRIVPSLDKPYKMNKDALADLRLAADIAEADSVAPDKLFVHPAAATFPGVCAPGAPVTRDITFRAASPAESAYVNDAGHGTWIETGLYADAGKAVTIRIPEKFAGKGLHAVIGIHEDRLWRSDNASRELLRFPDVTRDVELTAAETKLGTPFGGLVRLYTNAGVDLGEVTATIDGAVEAPVFELSKTTPGEWAKQRTKPGAWGYIRTPLFTGYLPREAFVALADPAPIARHWQRVMSLADEWLGYAKWRLRPDTAVQDVQITVGLHHSGYPLMLGGDDKNILIAPTLPAEGDWGVYHELGHGYQSCFRGEYTLATHAEVDVNLVPGIVYYYLHGRTPWDGETHSTYDGPSREEAMKKFLALPERERTWALACESPVAYDFNFGLAEAFGWKVWKTALGRLLAFDHDKTSDAELAAINEGDEEQQKRDRLLVCLSDASGYNLSPWFLKYGLGRGKFPVGEKALATVANLPAWNGNRPVEALEGPASVNATGAKPDAVLATFRAVDPDPGQTFEWDITAGNDDGALRVDKRTGAVVLVKPVTAGRTITLRVRDCGVPRYGKTKDIRVE